MATILLSYAREDLEAALSLKQKVEALGHKVWIDLEGMPAASLWREEIARAIEQADVFLFGLTPDSASSSECQKELDHAQQIQKRVIPVVLRTVEPEQVHASLRDIDWVLLRPEDAEPAGLRRLEGAITVDLEHLHRHTRFLLRALEWERSHRDRSLLLRGSHLEEAEQWLAQSPGKEPAPIPQQRELVQASRLGEKRRRAWQAAVAALLLALSLIAAYIAYQRAQTARADLSRRLARDSVSAESLDRKLLLAVAAHEVAPTGDAVRSLLAGLEENRQLLTLLHGHDGDVDTLAFHPGRPLLVSGGSDGSIRLWDTTSWSSLGLIPTGSERIVRLVFSPQGSFLISGDWAGRVRLWDLLRKQEILPHLDSRGRGLVESLAVHPTGRYLAAGFDTGALLWDLGKDPPAPIEVPIDARRVPETDFDSDGRRLALLEGTETLVVWDFSEGRLSARREYRSGLGTTALAWHPDGHQLVLGHSDGSLTWVDASDMSEIRRVPGQGAGVLDLSFNEDGTFLAAAGKGGSRVWHDEAASPLLTLPGPGRVFSVAFQAGTSYLASAGMDPAIHLWDPGLFQPLSRPVLRGRSSIQQVVVDSEGRWLIAGDLNGRLIRIDRSTGEGEEIPVNTGGEVGGIAVARDRLLWSGEGGLIGLWDLTGREKPLNRHAQGFTLTSVALRDNGEVFATGSQEGRVSIWRLDAKSGQLTEHPLQVKPGQTLGFTMDLSFSPDGRLLAAGDNDGNVILWDVSSLRLVRAWKVGATTDLAFSPDGRRIAIANGGDGRIMLLDVSREEIPQPETGECGRVFSVAFRREGRFLVAGCDDGSVEHFEVKPWRALGRVRSYGEFVYSLSPFRSGDMMASGTSDGRVMVWDFDETSWKRRACRRANRDLPKDIRDWSGLPADLCARLLRDAPQEPPGLRQESAPDLRDLPDNVATLFIPPRLR